MQTPTQSHRAGERQRQDLCLALGDSRTLALSQDTTQPLAEHQRAGPWSPSPPEHSGPGQQLLRRHREAGGGGGAAQA